MALTQPQQGAPYFLKVYEIEFRGSRSQEPPWRLRTARQQVRFVPGALSAYARTICEAKNKLLQPSIEDVANSLLELESP